MTLDPTDPLYDGTTPPQPRKAQRIPRSANGFAKIEWPALATRSNDDIFPPLTRLCLYLQLRSRHSRESIILTNNALLDLGISRWQKYRLLTQLEASGRITVEREHGLHPVVTIQKPWW
jgi:hypothetical protein